MNEILGKIRYEAKLSQEKFAELIGVSVFASQGEYTNIKVTTPEDMLIAQAFLQEMEYE